MIELLLGGLIAVGLLFALIALPLMLVAGVLKVLVWVVLVPFRLLGALVGAVVAVIGGLGGLLLGGVALGAGILGTIALAIALPLLPLLAFVFVAALLIRAVRPRGGRAMRAA